MKKICSDFDTDYLNFQQVHTSGNKNVFLSFIFNYNIHV